jgi:hypothetical protein
MKKIIAKPSRWQDFESLCKMLWGEMWNIPDKIKQNGRLGQVQFGVDVYGVPKGKQKYSGIQCKGKNDELKSVLTEKEIDEEIEKAKSFIPALETFIFATTSNKDVKLEQYIRQKDIESRTNGGFEILLYCWEDISDLIETNRNTFNYYVSQNQFKSNFELDLTFDNGEKSIKVYPLFQKRLISYLLENTEQANLHLSSLASTYEKLSRLHRISGFYEKVNRSWVRVGFRFKNTGSTVIEDYKLIITPENDKISEIKDELNLTGRAILRTFHGPFYVYEKEKYGVYKRKDNEPLTQQVEKSFELFILLTNRETHSLNFECAFFSRDFHFKETLTIVVEPKYNRTYENILVQNSDNVKTETILEDLIN